MKNIYSSLFSLVWLLVHRSGVWILYGYCVHWVLWFARWIILYVYGIPHFVFFGAFHGDEKKIGSRKMKTGDEKKRNMAAKQHLSSNTHVTVFAIAGCFNFVRSLSFIYCASDIYPQCNYIQIWEPRQGCTERDSKRERELGSNFSFRIITVPVSLNGLMGKVLSIVGWCDSPMYDPIATFGTVKRTVKYESLDSHQPGKNLCLNE